MAWLINYLLFGALGTLVLTYLIGCMIIPWLTKLKFGQKILDIGPKWHASKQGTPIMGGLMFIISSSVAVIVIGIYAGVDLRRALNVLVMGLAFALIGFLDDYTKITKKRNLGLRPLQKIVLQLSVSLVFLFAMRISGFLEPTIYIPFFNLEFDLGWVGYYTFGAFVMVGFVNAVNLNDGIDGLAAGTTLPVMVFFAAVFYAVGEHSMGIYSAVLAGALLGFLIFNFPPAKVFMGDTGSLFLGGMVSGMAFALNMPLILVTVGFIYALEALSDILQVAFFKLTHGRRLFKMAPIHHHFEMCGFSEKQIALGSAAITSVLCAVSFYAVLLRFKG